MDRRSVHTSRAQQGAMMVNLVRHDSHFMNAFPFYIVSITKHLACTHILKVLLLTFTIFILTKMLFTLNVYSLKGMYYVYNPQMHNYPMPHISIVL